MKQLKFLLSLTVVLLMSAATIQAQFVGPAPLVVPTNTYAFAWSPNGTIGSLTTYGLYFKAGTTTPGFEFRGASGAKLVNVNSISTGNREAGDITFGNTGSLIVNPNRYAFRFSLTNSYGLFFNATGFAYEFRTADASPVFSVGANSGNITAKGDARFGESSGLVPNRTFAPLVVENDSAFGVLDPVLILRSAPSLRPALLFSENAGTQMGFEYNGLGAGDFNKLHVLDVDKNRIATFESGGDFGIGTENPTEKLHVVSQETAGYAGAIRLSTPNLVAGTGEAVLQFGVNASTANQAELRFRYEGFSSLSNRYEFGFSNIQPVMVINAAGDVGIGTVDPTNKLDVNGKISVTQSVNDEMVIINDDVWEHGTGNQDFGDGGDHFIIASKETSFESSGVHGDGDALTLWSPGDGATGQPSALIYVCDEDGFTSADTDPFNGTALKAYLTTAGTWMSVSDRNKKENITALEGSLDKILKLNGYSYNFKLAPTEIEKGDQAETTLGVVAQEVYEVVPELVDINANGDHFVSYTEFIPLLIESIKELDANVKEIPSNPAQVEKIEKLERENVVMKEELAQIKDLLTQFDISLDECCTNHQKAEHINGVNIDKAELGQNIPNPFAQSTVIPFYVPEGAQDARIQITDQDGRSLKEFNISTTGMGSVEFSPSHLSAGTYMYSLIIDGKLVDTKKMMTAN